ncbi:MAG: DEAD/DEAH box helicase [Gammaproteobacteria bacterium]|nr:DEAD/DEAH box helicase [Gammaproteobacteria bacterium]
MTEEVITRFSDLALAAPILKAVAEVGYETPSPIQARTIPPLLEGRDLLGVAQTGTGKTAAFALPLLSRLDLARRRPQLLVLTPTRELAIQVAEAMQAYARHLPGFHVLPVYGGQGMGTQLRQLERGVHVVVGTPGRVQDHLRRATLVLDHLAAVVLDEADEMLRMGFIDDVEEILRRAPEGRQVALFSATMPEPIRRVARTHLHDPVEVRIEAKTSTVKTIRQRYWQVSGTHKLDALTRILEVEDFNGLLIFVRTKVATEELAEKLEARGYACSALNGDMNQALREKTVERLKGGALDIVVATDVAARGLDVERISHVVNYDIPYDTEAYVHRIGRTGRAGRKGEAILFVAPRERRMLAAIERATGQKIAPMQLPTRADIAGRRIEQFKQSITDAIEGQELGFFEELVEAYQGERNIGLAEIAAALAFLVQRERPLLEDLPEEAPARQAPPPRAQPVAPARGGQRPDRRPAPGRSRRDESTPDASGHGRPVPEREGDAGRDQRRQERPRPTPVAASAAPRRESGGTAASREKDAPARAPTPREPKPSGRARAEDARLADPAVRAKRPGKAEARAEPGTVRYRLEVGRAHGAEPKHIVGAIANEAGLESRYIGRLTIHDDHSTVDLPEGMPKDIFKHLRKVWVCGRQLQLSALGADAPAAPEAKPRDKLRLKPPAPHAAKPGGGKPKPRKPFKSKRP